MAAEDELNNRNQEAMLDVNLDGADTNNNGINEQRKSVKSEPRSPDHKHRSRSRSPRRNNQSPARKNSRSPSRKSRRRKRSGSRGTGRTDDRHKMVYITNIPYDVRWMEMKDLIREKAGEVSFVEMIEKEGRSKGCAVVEFKTRENALKCLETMHRMEMGDRRLVVKEIREPETFFRKVREEHGVDFMANRSAGNRNSIASKNNSVVKPFGFETYGLCPEFLNKLSIEGPLCNRVFVANLTYNVSSLKLKEIFSLAGQVNDIDLQLDKDGKSKGLAVIEYSHPIEAVQAISMLHHQELFDRAITVKMDRFDKPIDNRRPGDLPIGLRHIGMGLGANGAPLTNISQLVSAGNFGTPSRSRGAGAFVTPFASSDFLGGGGGGGGSFYSGGPLRSRLDDSPPPTGRLYVSGGGSSSVPSLSRLSGGGGGPSITPFTSSGFSSGAAQFSSHGGSAAYDYFRERERDRERERERDYRSMERDHMIDGPRGAGDGIGAMYGGGARASIGASLGNLVGPSSGSYYEPLSGIGRSAGPPSPYASGYGGNSATGGMGIATIAPDGYARAVTQSLNSSTVFDPYNQPIGSPPRPSGVRPLRAILIRNLPLDYSWQTLRDRMRGFGEVEFADIIQPGVGKVRFKSAVDADNACVSLHGMHVEGRPITVDLVNSD